MGKYLNMSDVFTVEIRADDESGSLICDEDGIILESFSGDKVADYTLHAIKSHDELVAEVGRLRRQLACAFMAGWEEGINGMECDEAEVASIELAEQFARN